MGCETGSALGGDTGSALAGDAGCALVGDFAAGSAGGAASTMGGSAGGASAAGSAGGAESTTNACAGGASASAAGSAGGASAIAVVNLIKVRALLGIFRMSQNRTAIAVFHEGTDSSAFADKLVPRKTWLRFGGSKENPTGLLQIESGRTRAPRRVGTFRLEPGRARTAARPRSSHACSGARGDLVPHPQLHR